MLENQLSTIRKFFFLAAPFRGERSLFQNNIRRVIHPRSTWQHTSPPSASHKRGRVANSTTTCLSKRRERNGVKSIFVLRSLMTIDEVKLDREFLQKGRNSGIWFNTREIVHMQNFIERQRHENFDIFLYSYVKRSFFRKI